MAAACVVRAPWCVGDWFVVCKSGQHGVRWKADPKTAGRQVCSSSTRPRAIVCQAGTSVGVDSVVMLPGGWMAMRSVVCVVRNG